MVASTMKCGGKVSRGFEKAKHFGGGYGWVDGGCRGVIVARMWSREDRKRAGLCESRYIYALCLTNKCDVTVG